MKIENDTPLKLSPYILNPSVPKPICVMGLVRQLQDKTWGYFKDLKVSEFPLELIHALKAGDHAVIMEAIGLLVAIGMDMYKAPYDNDVYEVLCDVAYQTMRFHFFDSTMQNLTVNEIVVVGIEAGIASLATMHIERPKGKINPSLN